MIIREDEIVKVSGMHTEKSIEVSVWSKRFMGNFRETIKLLTVQLVSVPALRVRIRGQRTV
jgi:hypothetical protein